MPLRVHTACLAALALPFTFTFSATNVSAVQPVAGSVYAQGLSVPVDFVQHPNEPGVQFVLQQNGLIRTIIDGALQPDPLIDLGPIVSSAHQEHGLISMAIDPADDDGFYVHYIRNGGASQIDYIAFTSQTPWTGDINQRERILRRPQPRGIHNGNAMRFGPDGYLYIAYGDGGPISDPDDQGQNLATIFGTISRIDPDPSGDYDIPEDNPFVGVPGAAPEIWAYGLRNPWKISFDVGPCGTGGLLIGDVGNFAVEELDFILPQHAGANFGWKCREGDIAFSGCEPPEGEEFTEPIFAYDRATGFGASVTAGYVYRGAEMPSNRGRAFFADFASGRVFSLRLTVDDITGDVSADDLVEHTSQIQTSAGVPAPNVVSFGRDAEGELYVLSYTTGRIIRLTGAHAPADITLDGAVDSNDLAQLLAQWGSEGCATTDLDNDGSVDSRDLAALLAAWNPGTK